MNKKKLAAVGLGIVTAIGAAAVTAHKAAKVVVAETGEEGCQFAANCACNHCDPERRASHRRFPRHLRRGKKQAAKPIYLKVKRA